MKGKFIKGCITGAALAGVYLYYKQNPEKLEELKSACKELFGALKDDVEPVELCEEVDKNA